MVSRVSYEDLIQGNVSVLETHLSTHNLKYNPLKAQSIPVAAYTKNQHLLVGQDADKTKVNKPAKSKTEIKLKSKKKSCIFISKGDTIYLILYF